MSIKCVCSPTKAYMDWQFPTDFPELPIEGDFVSGKHNDEAKVFPVIGRIFYNDFVAIILNAPLDRAFV